MVNDDNSPEEEFNFDLEVKVITITHRGESDIPEVDIGSFSAIEAMVLLRSAAETLDLLVPHFNVSANGEPRLRINEGVELGTEDDD